MTAGSGPNFRIDFIFKKIQENPDGSILLVSVPDPNRYDRIKRKGRWMLVDRFTHMMFDEQRVMEQVANSMKHIPVRYEPSKIRDTRDWIQERRGAIAALLEGQGHPHERASRSQDELLSSVGADHPFSFASLFVANSLEFGSLPNADQATVTATLSHELGLVADLYSGSLWRSSPALYSFFFRAPNLISKVDLSLGFATTARDVVKMINSFLRDRRWPELRICIGIEAGSAMPHIAGLQERFSTLHLAGLAVSFSETLARLGSDGDVLLGPMAAQLSHVSWRKLMSALEPQPAGVDMSAFPPEVDPVVYRLAPDAYSPGSLLYGQDVDDNPIPVTQRTRSKKRSKKR
jgi:hypothetical protein